MFVFDGAVFAGEWLEQITLDLTALTGFEFHEVDTIAEVTIARLARQISHAAVARNEGTTAYLENGQPVVGIAWGLTVHRVSAHGRDLGVGAAELPGQGAELELTPLGTWRGR